MCGFFVQDLRETGQWGWCRTAWACKILGQWSCATFLWRQGEKHKPQHHHLGICLCKGKQQLAAPTSYMYKWVTFEHAPEPCYNHDPGAHTGSQCLKTYSSMKSKRSINWFWTLISSVWCQLSSCHHFQVAVSLSLVPHPNRICTQSFRGEEQIPALRSAHGSKSYVAPNVKESSNSMLNNWFDVYASHRWFSVGHHPPVVNFFS